MPKLAYKPLVNTTCRESMVWLVIFCGVLIFMVDLAGMKIPPTKSDLDEMCD